MADESSVKDEELTCFLMKEIPKPLWAEVKAYVYDQEPKMTLLNFLLIAAKEKLVREKANG